MATEIKSWQITEGRLNPLDESMVVAGRKEVDDLEKWIKSRPEILGDGIVLIGEQVQTKSGPLDFLGIDESGNLVIVELKRDRIPRDALAQAMDYASDIALWDRETIGNICVEYTGKTLEECLSENFEELEVEEISINKNQRILLVGFSTEEALVRMVEWLSDRFDISINALILHYVRTKGQEEFLSRTSIIPEDVAVEKTRKDWVKLHVSDEPGTYDDVTLRNKLLKFLQKETPGAKRIREILLPLCLKNEVVARGTLKKALLDANESEDETEAGLHVTSISNLLGFRKRDYLRQAIEYSREKDHQWTKTDYRIKPQYREMIQEILKEVQN